MTTAEKMRNIAAALDTSDNLLVLVSEMLKRDDLGHPGTEMQDDLRAWAEVIDVVLDAAEHWAVELETYVIPSAGTQDERDGYEAHATEIENALTVLRGARGEV